MSMTVATYRSQSALDSNRGWTLDNTAKVQRETSIQQVRYGLPETQCSNVSIQAVTLIIMSKGFVGCRFSPLTYSETVLVLANPSQI